MGSRRFHPSDTVFSSWVCGLAGAADAVDGPDKSAYRIPGRRGKCGDKIRCSQPAVAQFWGWKFLAHGLVAPRLRRAAGVVWTKADGYALKPHFQSELARFNLRHSKTFIYTTFHFARKFILPVAGVNVLAQSENCVGTKVSLGRPCIVRKKERSHDQSILNPMEFGSRILPRGKPLFPQLTPPECTPQPKAEKRNNTATMFPHKK